ncbi:hypothetical protein DNTS_020281, partial [Danionella cerebrum]
DERRRRTARSFLLPDPGIRPPRRAGRNAPGAGREREAPSPQSALMLSEANPAGFTSLEASPLTCVPCARSRGAGGPGTDRCKLSRAPPRLGRFHQGS